MTLTFSVVIAAYQAEDTVGQAIELAVHETVLPLEVIVCDDGSSDKTSDVARSYGARRPTDPTSERRRGGR